MANNLYMCYETAVGFSLFRVLEAESVNIKTLQDSIKNANTFQNMLKLEAFTPFSTQVEALESINKISEGIAPPALIQFLLTSLPTKSSNIKSKSKSKNENLRTITLGVADANLGQSIKEILNENESDDSKLLIECRCDSLISELLRGIRKHFDLYIGTQYNFIKGDCEKAQIGLGHSYSRMKIKFNVNRADNMIIQAICLLDQLDKDLNTYCMRAKEWYGWHFPELTKILSDQVLYVKIMYYIGDKTNMSKLGSKSDTIHEEMRKDDGSNDNSSQTQQLRKDEATYLAELDEITEDALLAQKIIDVAKSSMGVEVSQIDIVSMKVFAKRILTMAEYRKNLYQYLCDRMENCAPNLSALMGEQIGARLISKAGSLLKLAKYPASTIQILGAEKALFRALKSKGMCNTPKYGLIYNTSYITKATAKNKGRISRYLANKAAMATRLDCFLDVPTDKYGSAFRKQVEERLTFFKSGTVPSTNAKVMSDVRSQLLLEAGGDSDSDAEEQDIDLKESEMVTKSKKSETKTKVTGSKRATLDDSEDVEMIEPPKKKQKLTKGGSVDKKEAKASKKAAKKEAKKKAKAEKKAAKKAAKKEAKKAAKKKAKAEKKSKKKGKKAAKASDNESDSSDSDTDSDSD